MSRYPIAPQSFEDLHTIPIAERGGKVKAAQFAQVYQRGSGMPGLLESLPHILAGDSFRAVVESIAAARAARRAVICGIGGHVIKCGLAPLLAELARLGFVTAFAMNGAAAIHDFEIAIAGETSEDVEAVLPDGRFGSAEETGRQMNEAIREGASDAIGMGEALGRKLQATADSQFRNRSLLYTAYGASLPVTVHVAIGTDTPHTHPAADPASIGVVTHHDFRLLCSLVKGLHEGGVFLNMGSAVVMPEVFLKALSVMRNLGHPLSDFTTVNFDFIQHYRPLANVVQRPHAGGAGRGYAITGHHEILVPLLTAALIERSA